ncbi:hypothetical protein [Sphaerotilus sp.]|uniref:hypothetical protein n=1 Tax=Sphaerotilus sp. TaxID=2093942 RepID=UPI0034E300F1
MQRMDMEHDQFARRLGASRRRLDDWLKRTGEPGSIELDPVIWTFVRELVERAEEADAREARDSAAAPLGGPEIPISRAMFSSPGRWLT